MVRPVLVVGAGAVGCAVAFHIAQAGHPVEVLEKEAAPAQHQSGRNSGVIHAGYNPPPGTAKARFCVEGNRRLRAWCEAHGVPMDPGGILVVARTEEERGVLSELERRATENGARVRRRDRDQLRELEPNAEGVEALHAIDGASFDAPAYVRSVVLEAERLGVRFRYGTRVRGLESPAGARVPGGVRLRTNRGPVEGSFLVNCAGLQADRIANGAQTDLRVIPFRGYYAELRPPRCALVRSHVYGVPDLKFPFLGLHLSRRTDGRVIVGPGAMLAFGREAYSFWRANPRDLASLATWPGFWRLLARPEFRGLIRSEVSKSLRLRAVWNEARRLVPAVRPHDLVRSFAGNRAQLVSRDGRLVDDMVLLESGRSLHVLNAVSPGLTCSLPFGEHVADRVGALL